MNTGYDAEYYLRREQSARQLAERAINPCIAEIHLQMADNYARLAREARPVLRIVTRQ